MKSISFGIAFLVFGLAMGLIPRISGPVGPDHPGRFDSVNFWRLFVGIGLVALVVGVVPNIF